MACLMETRDYANFDPYWYIENHIGNDFIGMQQDLDSLHKIFAECKVSGKRRLLDVGTGPTVHSVITASNHVDEIFLSDYAPQNLQYLAKWRKGEIAHPKKLLDYVLSLEDRLMTAEERENEVRDKVKGILPIDVTSEQPLGKDYDGGKFDVVISSHCIDAAVYEVDELAKCMKNVSSLLNEGGLFIIACDFGATFFQIGEYKYDGSSFTKEEVKTVMVEAGFEIKEYLEISNYEHQYCDAKGYFFIAARKLFL
ncbi:nicotinamide N-methyltransferase-like [Pecten maximus]|uniref:nicotinamide N-methyltransferase-like n=1 Tax=Pecten maximus TaxID=6579 RepID=UPI001458278A|nr:nicotinamide N-methyltransferase-like [Pecten maximus]